MPFDPVHFDIEKTIIADLELQPLQGQANEGHTFRQPAPKRPPRPGRLKRLVRWLLRRKQ
jgi:hypothetical protein